MLPDKTSILRNEQVETGSRFIETISVIGKMKLNLSGLRVNFILSDELINFRLAKKLHGLLVIIDIDNIRKDKGGCDVDKTPWIQGSLNIEFISDNLKQVQPFKLPILKILLIQIKSGVGHCFF